MGSASSTGADDFERGRPLTRAGIDDETGTDNTNYSPSLSSRADSNQIISSPPYLPSSPRPHFRSPHSTSPRPRPRHRSPPRPFSRSPLPRPFSRCPLSLRASFPPRTGFPSGFAPSFFERATAAARAANLAANSRRGSSPSSFDEREVPSPSSRDSSRPSARLARYSAAPSPDARPIYSPDLRDSNLPFPSFPPPPPAAKPRNTAPYGFNYPPYSASNNNNRNQHSALPECLIADKECWRALDPSKTGAKEGFGRPNFDVWVEKEFTSVVLCVADKRNKCRGVIVRYRIDERMHEVKEAEGLDLDLGFDVGTSGKGAPVWKKGVLGLKVIDFWRPGVGDKELQAALGETTSDVFGLLEDVDAIQIHGGAGPSMSGNVEYPIDARMRRYLDMEENVQRLAMELGYEQVSEEQKPMGVRWVLEFPRDALDDLFRIMDKLSRNKLEEKVWKERERKIEFERCAEEEEFKVVNEAGAGGTKYVEDAGVTADLMDMALLNEMERRGFQEVRTRADDARRMPISTGDLPVRNSGGGLGPVLFSASPSPSGSVNSDTDRSIVLPWEENPGLRGRAILRYIERDSPESGEVDGTRSEDAIPEQSTMLEHKESTSPKPGQEEESRSEGDSMSSPEIATLFKDEQSSDDEMFPDEESSSEDADDEGDRYHLSGSNSPENKPTLVEGVDVDAEKAGGSLDGNKDVDVSVRPVYPSDEDSPHDDSSDDE
ncbi:hypothetical protein NEUTE1DRAFT_93415 [Neurospora tetrasperma FGSC 2508]|uniref:Uncharacterized protein n=1 Tax=Neurospora tetrasperma (strain FGSC 2508 / ATCC MYA-4615 / P0657) TaxID=510951 RepID=F8N0G3_NEUT8|nr:uncharacterized protein NEUTE1DRAFT_93415 [Neurospora tetrasperma FGSC 2508]EGO53791.1 hypothetical protein NEUTE1DRAFT_93415 [Neurospora tetrasperma FGSC 2508]EGZ76126.1 hypothetical protein NEUTE2DRAFT_153147 [Neurospora tetrasperma FGSC 2509]